MSTRRDFMAALTARQELEAMAEWDEPTAGLLEVWDRANPRERLCMVLFVQRVHRGMDVPAAGEAFRLDLADPSRAVSL